jgi:hypothetical protein
MCRVMSAWKGMIQKELSSAGELSELFRVPCVSPDAGPRASTTPVGELVFTDKAVCFVLHSEYRVFNIWSFPIQMLYAILIAMGAGLLFPPFGLAGAILGSLMGALLARLFHVLLKRRSERALRDGIEAIVRGKVKRGLEGTVAFLWRSAIADIEITEDRLVLKWTDSPGETKHVELKLLAALDADLTRRIRSYAAETRAV